jgi:outer membrane protein
MKKTLFLSALVLSISTTHAANLVQVFGQALTNDTIYKQAVSQSLANEEGVPISLGALLPGAALTASPFVQKTLESGPVATLSQQSGSPTRFTQRGYQMQLSITQTIFDFGKLATFMGARATAKQADATLNAALQNLIVRVAQAYFQVLQDQDNLASAESSKAAYEKQLDQVNQQYKVGLKTITDVYTAEASYDSSVANVIAAKNQIAIDKENLRVITGVFYPDLSKLSEQFPLVSPQPNNMDIWVTIAQQQNWSIKAAQFAADAARQNIKKQFAGNLPSLNIQGNYTVNASRYITSNVALAGSDSQGSSKSHESQLMLNLSVPLFAGGSVIAETNQAQYQYQVAQQQLEQTLRNTINQARQNYLDITAEISKIQADKRAIISARSSYEGLEEGYRIGTETLVNVLTQQQVVYQAELQYATDRYAYVNNLLALKQAAGTLSPQDLATINVWLSDNPATTPSKNTVAANHSEKQIKKSEKTTHIMKKSTWPPNKPAITTAKNIMKTTAHIEQKQIIIKPAENTPIMKKTMKKKIHFCAINTKRYPPP